jgi:hypothetical protein
MLHRKASVRSEANAKNSGNNLYGTDAKPASNLNELSKKRLNSNDLAKGGMV